MEIFLNSITLTMTDQLTGKTVYTTIDRTNAMNPGDECWRLPGEGSQRANLEQWIDAHGNDLHNTILSLDSWVIN